jgi:hypothetical protein
MYVVEKSMSLLIEIRMYMKLELLNMISKIKEKIVTAPDYGKNNR